VRCGWLLPEGRATVVKQGTKTKNAIKIRNGDQMLLRQSIGHRYLLGRTRDCLVSAVMNMKWNE